MILTLLSRQLNAFGSPMLAVSLASFSGVARSASLLAVRSVLMATLLLLGLAAVSGGVSWVLFADTVGARMARDVGLVAGVLSFSLAFVTRLQPQWSPLLAPAYSVSCGVFMAGLAYALEQRHPGIAVQAVLVSLTVFGVMLVLYAGRWLRATSRFRLVVYVATAAIVLVYLAALLLKLSGMPLTWLGNGGFGAVLWHGFVALTAALNLVLDFERIEHLARRTQPAWMTWYVGIGLMVTLVWLYVSILRLLASMRR